VRGGAEKSYGIEVARLAGLPAPVIERAREILSSLEAMESARIAREAAAAGEEPSSSVGPKRRGGSKLSVQGEQLSLFHDGVHPLVDRLAAIDINHLTPLEALNLLAELCRQAKEAAS